MNITKPPCKGKVYFVHYVLTCRNLITHMFCWRTEMVTCTRWCYRLDMLWLNHYSELHKWYVRSLNIQHIFI